jgi:transcription elongation GreA/GreB family factor
MAWLCALAAALAIGVVIAMFPTMSVAFTREEDLEATAADLADRPISPHPNLVTPEGLAAIEAELASARAAYTAAQVQGSIESDRTAMARATRDLRYWSARRASAQLIAPTEDDGAVRFGGSVSIEREDGRAQTWRIVGEDEADPAAGSVSHVSPLARAVMGKRVGDEVTVAGQSAEIVAVG